MSVDELKRAFLAARNAADATRALREALEPLTREEVGTTNFARALRLSSAAMVDTAEVADALEMVLGDRGIHVRVIEPGRVMRLD